MRIWTMAAAAVVMAAASMPAMAQNLVTNGGFETGTFSGWTLNSTDNVVVGNSDFGPVYNGTYSAFFGQVGSSATLTQSLATTIGQTYTISFALRNFSDGTPNNYSVSFGGVTLDALVNAPAFAYGVRTFTGIATGTTTNLQFSVRHDPSYYGLDDVSVTANIDAAVPEPATWALMLMGFGMVGAGMRARRRSVSFAGA